jgi:hypothetical protein
LTGQIPREPFYAGSRAKFTAQMEAASQKQMQLLFSYEGNLAMPIQ